MLNSLTDVQERAELYDRVMTFFCHHRVSMARSRRRVFRALARTRGLFVQQVLILLPMSEDSQSHGSSHRGEDPH